MLTYIKLHKYIRSVGISASILLVLFAFLTAFPLSHRDNSAEATANPATTTLEISSSSDMADIQIDVNDSRGTFDHSWYGGMEFTVTTDNLTGYTLALSGTEDTGKLINTTDGQSAIDSISSVVSYNSFAQTYGTSYNGKWGIRPNYINSVSNGAYDNYYPAPTTADPIIMDTTEGPSTSSKFYSVGIGARLDYNTPPGKYVGTYMVQAVGRPVMYGINYLDSTGDSMVADLPAADSSSTSTAVNFTLDSGSPTRDGYTFIGWCDGTVSHTTYPSTCDGDTYMPGASYDFADLSATETNIATFYAMWQVAGYTITFNTVDAASIDFDGTTYTDGQSVTVEAGTYSLRGNYDSRYAFSSWNATAGTISNAEYVDYNLNTYTMTEDATITLTGQYVETAIQNLDMTSCTSTPMPTYDNRDGQVYWVKKLDDGNCWMMDNLNLGAVDLSSSLTSSNTNLSSSISASTFNGWRKSSGTATRTSAEMIPLSKSNSRTNDDVDATSGTKLGTLYNYCAASAGTICTDSNSNNATYDICPSGWRLPKGGTTSDSTNEFNNLYTNSSYNTNAKMRAPVSEGGAAFALAGYFYDAAPRYQGSYGSYWSSVRSDSTYMYILYLNTSNVYPGNLSSRGYGLSVRCIRDPDDITTVTYLQDVTDRKAANTSIGTVATLKDKRDEEEYLVGKLADGKIWMLDNLRLDPTAVSLATLKGNTNATDQILTYFKNGGGSSPYPASGVSSGWSSSSQDSYNLPYINTSYKNTVASATYGSGSGKIGVYYNYCAASAGSYCYAGGAGTGNAAYDICPKNWRLPVGGTTSDTTNEFNNLYVAYGSDHTAFKEALSTPLSGYFYSGSASSQGSRGYFWSSTFYDTYNMRSLHVYSSGVYPGYNLDRSDAFSVRCVFN